MKILMISSSGNVGGGPSHIFSLMQNLPKKIKLFLAIPYNKNTKKFIKNNYHITSISIKERSIYFKDIFNNHSSSLSIEETLYLLTKIYLSIEENELAKEYASILAYNFPESIWYEKSYNIVNEIETVSNEEYWYKKFNPIKLFINNQKEENFEIQKID